MLSAERRKDEDMLRGEECERRIEHFIRSSDATFDLMNMHSDIFIEIKYRYTYKKDDLSSYIIGKNKLNKIKEYPSCCKFYFINEFIDGTCICRLDTLSEKKEISLLVIA